MAKKYFFWFCILLGLNAQAQIVNIPDANFKNALINTLCADLDNNNTYEADVDTDNDGEIQVSEALAVFKLNVSNQSIADLTGIESFQNMTRLGCDNNQISTLTLNNFFNLVGLYCSYNNMSSLTLTNCFNLNTFNCIGNLMTTLDLSSTRISRIFISNNPNLTNINLKNGVSMDASYAGRNSNQSQAIPPPPPSRIESNPNLVYVCADDNEINYLDTIVILNNNNQNIFVSSYCTEQPGGNFNTVSGVVHYDCDGLSFPASFVKITYSNGFTNGYTYTSVGGNYHFYAPTGPLTITTQTEENSFFTASPASHTMNFETINNFATANFCLTVNGNSHNDLGVTVFNYGPARPGFDAKYKVVYNNRGNQTQSGSVSFSFDDTTMDFISANPVVNSQTTNTLTWNFTDLAPFETREILVTVNLNGPMETPPLNIGDILTYNAIVSPTDPDENPTNNNKTLRQIIVGSYDPNDKAVVEGSQISIANIGDYLHYIIRFQNTGTYAAENVVIKDMLSDDLDWSTLQMVSSSHTFRSTLTRGNQLEVFYEGINLPPSSEDEPGSNGYITFKIKPISTIAIDDVIENTADIYFDFNFPIVTNTVSTTVTALATSDFDTVTFTIYPNPTTTFLYISLNDTNNVKEVTVYNTLGQKLLTTINTNTIDVSTLSQGTYFITVETDNGKATQQFIKI
jgi:uncharacterized repeat protein (TIGR01451 family)